MDIDPEVIPIAKRFSGNGIVLVGHSRGGLIARKYLTVSMSSIKGLCSVLVTTQVDRLKAGRLKVEDEWLSGYFNPQPDTWVVTFKVICIYPLLALLLQ